MQMSLSMRGVAAAGLITLAVLFGAAPNASAQEATLEVWSHEADEPAKVAFRELAARTSRRATPGRRSRSRGTRRIRWVPR